MTTVPVVWLSYRMPTICARGTWDTGLLERIVDRRAWRPAGAIDYRPVIGFQELPADADGAVVVIGAQHHHLPDEVARLNADLARLRWVVLVLAGDECSLFPWRKLAPHPNMRLWVMTPRPHVHADCPNGTTFFGEGYRDDTPELLASFTAEAGVRPLDWFFAGQVTHSRRHDLVAALRRLDGRLGTPWKGDLVETPGFLQGLPRGEYLRRMASAKVVPCPSGPGTPDSFRLYEALEAGCLPLADAVTPDGWPGYWSFVYGDDLPFPVVEDWADLPAIMEDALVDWPANANRASAWWQAEKRRLAYRLDDDVRDAAGVEGSTSALADLVTVIMPTSPIPSHPSTAVIDETLDSLDSAGLGGCEVIVCADGVRPEQEHRRGDYEEYLRSLLWDLNHGRRNHLPLVFDEHCHQATMTRVALELVRTPLVVFVEHDTPLVGEIPWRSMVSAILEAPCEVDVIRLHHEVQVLEPHRYLMAGKREVVRGVPMQRTAQWSQRPHLASTGWYRSTLARYFPLSARTMIEDRLYGEIATPWVERHTWGEECKLWLYRPDGSIQRSTHLDGRAGETKYEMTWS